MLSSLPLAALLALERAMLWQRSTLADALPVLPFHARPNNHNPANDDAQLDDRYYLNSHALATHLTGFDYIDKYGLKCYS